LDRSVIGKTFESRLRLIIFKYLPKFIDFWHGFYENLIEFILKYQNEMKTLQKEKRKIIQYYLERLHNEEILTEQKAIKIIKVF
jgi:hypothetical protein